MTKFKLTKKSMKQIASAYNWSTGAPIKLSPRLAHSACPRWRNGSMAPILLTSPKIKVSDLASIEQHFVRQPGKHFYDAKVPFVQWYDDGFYETGANIQVLQKHGWSLKPGPVQHINIWTEPVAVQLPPGFEVVVKTYGRSKERADFLELMRENFGSTEEFLTDLEHLFFKVAQALTLVVIYKSGKPAAAGLAHTHENATYLLCGSVSKRYRGRGLWRTLLGARQAFTNSGPGHVWVMTSANDFIRESAPFNARVFTYQKPAQLISN